ncbi:MAG TPA: hypothetical protein VFI18_00315 [Gaiellales bacterium]|nr:hypothetical protein [Gaiellales bacterium]
MALVVAVLAGLAGGAAVPPAAGAACGLIVVWHDRAYWGFGGGPAESDGKRLDGAVEPGCNDTAGANERPSAVAARTIPAVPPAVAIFSEGHTLVASGYFIEPSDLRVGDAAVPIHDETRGCALGGPVRIVGPAHPGFGLIDVTVDRTTVRLHHLLHGAALMFPDGRTRFEGLERNGLPYIAEGQRVRVDARFCKVPGSIGTKIVARRISPAGPIVAPTTAEDVLGADWRGTSGIVARATGGHSWAGYAALVLLAAVAALLILRRRSPRSGTG